MNVVVVFLSLSLCWLALGGTGSVCGASGWYLVILGQDWPVVIGTWWYWVSKRRYWLVPGGSGSVECGASWYMVVLGQYGAESRNLEMEN